jgi:pimeloyl-ACP methyl ester carboxylesterase
MPQRKWLTAAGRVLSAIVILACVGGATAITRSAAFQKPATLTAAVGSRLMLSPCHLESLSEEILCGAHEVFEDRAAGAGRRLTIQVAVLPPLRREAEPDPLFILSGGPGQGAREFAGVAATYFKAVRRRRAIVLVDLRGTGGSHPLTCLRGGDEMEVLAAGRDMFLGQAAGCLAELDRDPRHYTHAAALADLDEIRQRLGYERVNLWGGSWGTRAALIYALRFPHAVRHVVLDGAVPLGMNFPAPAAADAQRALDLLLDRCAADAACAAAFPNLRGELNTLLDRLERRPADVRFRHPRTGAPTNVTLGRDAVAEIVRVTLYTPVDAARVPLLVHHALRGDYAPLAAQFVHAASMSTDHMALGATMAILCSEDLSGRARTDLAGASSDTFLRASYAEGWMKRCDGWPAGPGIDSSADATHAPALILSGRYDPVTPPRWGEAMTTHFPNHAHLVVDGAAHNASFTGCVPDLVARFLDEGLRNRVEVSCASARELPSILTSDAGARR